MLLIPKVKSRLQTIAAQIGCCKEVIILSRCCYGGFSSGVKRVLDRAIAVSLPFVTYRGGRQNELHLRIYEARCRRTGMIWCGGLGIGGGVVLRWMCMLTGLFAVLDTGKFICPFHRLLHWNVG